MKRIIALLAAVLMAAPALAAELGDMHTGTHGGRFCGFPARFVLNTQQDGKWIFEGLIRIEQTNEVDRLWIEQYADNSLRVIRYLPNGATQVVQTRRPVFKDAYVDGGYKTYAEFNDRRSYGGGCEGADSKTWISVFPD